MSKEIPKKKKKKAKPIPLGEAVALNVGGVRIAPGETVHLDLVTARLPTFTEMAIPIIVRHGTEPGPRLWLNASIHGDEINGVEIIHRVLDILEGEKPKIGSLIAIPIVNVFGFIQQTRYLPDGRDLNRSFPGSNSGSLASRMARLLMDEIVCHCTHGIDLHTATNHRTNLPQIRADLDDQATSEFATAFAAPITMHAKIRDGSLRDASRRKKIPVLVYEAGEAQRFNDAAIENGIAGVLRAMQFLGMTAKSYGPEAKTQVIRKSSWIRAKRGGLLRLKVSLGERLERGQEIGYIGDPFGGEQILVKSSYSGIVIGMTQNPVVYQGDAVVHVSR